MEAVNKEEALLDWVRRCPLFSGGRTPLLGYLREYEGACAIRPVAGDEAVREYIAGGRSISYDFYFELMLPLSVTTDNVNALNMQTGRLWQQWLGEMEDAGSYPDFGAGCSCYEIKRMSNMPQMSQVFEGGIAKYQFPARIVYFEEN